MEMGELEYPEEPLVQDAVVCGTYHDTKSPWWWPPSIAFYRHFLLGILEEILEGLIDIFGGLSKIPLA
tara:strand:- start:3168 stop:3371 length:204 start_codon:yes stop_codon:yes gene_type:complete